MMSFFKEKCNVYFCTTMMKYGFSCLLTLWAFSSIGNKRYFVASMIELFLIAVVSNALMKKNRLGNVINGALIFFYNAQMMVLAFANSYVSMLMLTNLDSIEDLSGKAVVYIGAAVLDVVFSMLPIIRIQWNKSVQVAALSFGLCMEIVFMSFFGNAYSPMYSYIDLALQQYQFVQLNQKIEAALNDPEAMMELTQVYYKQEVVDYREKEENVTEQPNVILIFAEGVSQNLVSDSRMIMPNVAKYQKQSLSFTNYYNHTFATYRGLIGQLYSGYQLNNLDSNPLVSVQEILSEQGYDTYFLNTEPNNEEFTLYLNQLGFDEVLIDSTYECNGMVSSISDKDAYEILFHTALEKNKEETPFFMTIYTFGTHTSLNSTDQKFGDGMDAELNKFYDMDYQFGLFMEQFTQSVLAENTIVVFTSDHATYEDEDFSNAFPTYHRERTTFDKIPLFIYYKGITPEQVDAKGRNTLDLVPTLLDYLDISAPNYFLGSSLFAEEASNLCEYIYSDAYILYTSENNRVDNLIGNDLDLFQKTLEGYYLTKKMLMMP